MRIPGWEETGVRECVCQQLTGPFLRHLQEFPLNPKALSLGELYGEYDLNTNEWTDGVLSSVMRAACAGTQRAAGRGEQVPESPRGREVQFGGKRPWEGCWARKQLLASPGDAFKGGLARGEKTLVSLSSAFYQDEKPDEKWILFDGPVDTLWIESMNSVMDDNKVLTLINGERIAMPEQVPASALPCRAGAGLGRGQGWGQSGSGSPGAEQVLQERGRGGCLHSGQQD